MLQQCRYDVLPCVGIIDHCDDCALQSFFLYRPSGAIKIHIFLENSTDTSPYREFEAPIVPLDPSVGVPSMAAVDHT